MGNETDIVEAMKQVIGQYALVILLVIGAYFLGSYKTKVEYLEQGVGRAGAPSAPAPEEPVAQPPDMAKIEALFADKENMVFGDRDAKIKIVEFSDTSCPYCQVATGNNPELVAQMGAKFKPVSQGGSYVPPVPEIKKLVESGDAAFMWLYSQGRGNGELSTIALYCANEQGKFWQAHGLLMSNEGFTLVNERVKNDRAKSGEMAEFLKSVVDSTKLKACIDAKKDERRITSDPAIAQSFGYGATPTFFINETVVQGASSWNDSFKPIVDSLL